MLVGWYQVSAHGGLGNEWEEEARQAAHQPGAVRSVHDVLQLEAWLLATDSQVRL